MHEPTIAPSQLPSSSSMQSSSDILARYGLHASTKVVLKDLSMDHYNGLHGRVRSPTSNGDKIVIQLDGGKCVNVHPDKVEILSEPSSSSDPTGHTQSPTIEDPESNDTKRRRLDDTDQMDNDVGANARARRATGLSTRAWNLVPRSRVAV